MGWRDINKSGPIILTRIVLDQDGYDSFGSYFGVGDNVYEAAGIEGGDSVQFRARNRKEAKALVLVKLGDVEFVEDD